MPFNPYLNEIGCTYYSVVTKITHKKPVAVKFDFGGVLENELLYLKKLQHHPNVIQVYGRFQGPGEKGIVMELMSYNLSQVIEKTYGPRNMYSWFYQVCSALAAIHEMGHIHRDVKPHNVLLNEKMSIVKVIDFGVSRQDSRTEMTTRIGTSPFMAPEVADGSSNYTMSADVYSLEITIFVTATKQSVGVHWKNQKCWDWNKKICDNSLRIAVDRMLEKDTEKRPSMRRLRDYFDKLLKENICDKTKLEDETYSDLPCYGADDFLSDEEPLKPIESVAKAIKDGTHRLVSYHMGELTFTKGLAQTLLSNCYLVEQKVLGKIVFKEYLHFDGNVGVKSASAVQFSRELVACLSIPPHPNIVQFFGAVYDKDIGTPHGLLMEYMHGGSLFTYSWHDQPPAVELLNDWAKQIAKGVCFMHSQGMIHRDVKPSNVLLSRDLLVAKISDFGLELDVEGLSWFQLYSRIIGNKGVTPLRPKLGTLGDHLAAQDRLIERCWNNDPHKRPTFLEIVQTFDEDRKNLQTTDV